MKKVELTKLRSKKPQELEKIVVGKRLEVVRVRANTKAGKEKNLKKVKKLRREIAQILTISRQKMLAEVIDEKKGGEKTRKEDKVKESK